MGTTKALPVQVHASSLSQKTPWGVYLLQVSWLGSYFLSNAFVSMRINSILEQDHVMFYENIWRLYLQRFVDNVSLL